MKLPGIASLLSMALLALSVLLPGGEANAQTISGAVAGVNLIQTVTTTGAQSSITFSSIPATYKHLRLIGAGRSTQVGTGNDAVSLIVNGDAGANYARQWILGNGATLTAAQASPTNSAIIGELPTAGDVANYQGSLAIDFPYYSGVGFAKSWQGQCMTVNNTTIASLYIIPVNGAWNNTAAITSITLMTGSPMVAGSTFSLYGWN